MASSCPHINPKNYLQSLQGKLIYKDQCCKCFHDPRDPQGIDLCLKCLAGSCRANSHSDLHFGNTEHPIALNVKLIPKENPQEIGDNKSHELTKLAIGKAGGASLNLPEYDEIFQLKCLACKIDLDNNLLSGIISSVKQENSAFKKQDIVEWELEINPCEHTLTLEQFPKNSQQGLSHCHECDLSTNLWLCLVCGNVGCGRKNYDGTGGNGHAAAHSKTAHHCLVVKLGTITAEGSASIFCYDCDNDVSDGQLAEHLGRFGIKIADQRKTEKTMTELNLDANRALTLSSILEEGKVLHPLFGVGNTGMQNIGNSCYMNAVYQVLFSLPEFKQRYSGAVAEEHLRTCNKFAVDCLTCQLSKLGVGLQNGQYSKPEEVKIYGEDGKLEVLPEIQRYQQQGVAINDLRTLVGKHHIEFKTKQMQDALEYLQFFFDTLEKEEKIAQPGKKSILDVFQFKTQNKLTCTKCSGIKLVNGTTRQLDLPIPRPTIAQLQDIEDQKKYDGDNSKPSSVKSVWEDPEYATSFEKSLELLQSTDSMELNCPRCGQKTIFTSNNYLQSLPEYLVMPTKRLILENWVPKKLNAVISLPETIDLQSICAKPTLPTEFILQDDGKGEPEEQEQQVDQTQLFSLLEMGFGENRSKRALILNNNNAEAAMNYLFEHAEDNSLDLPLEKKSAKSGKAGKFQVNEEDLGMLESMGFDGVQSRLALKKYANNLELALDALSNGEYFIDEDVPAAESSNMEEEIQPIVSANYELHAAIVHLGKSVHAGHYIAYVRRDGKWIYLNDAKVAISDEPSLGKGYIYVLKRK